VVLLPDNDHPGRKFANTAAADIARVAASTKVVQLPELPAGGDVSDWVAGQDPQGVREVLLELIEEAPEWKPAQDRVIANPLILDAGTVADLRAMQFEEEPAIVQGFLYRRGISQITGEGGIGKGFLGIQLLAALAIDGPSEWIGLHVPEGHRPGYFQMEGYAPRHHHRIDAACRVYGSDWMRRAEIRVPGFGGASFWDITQDEPLAQLMEWMLKEKIAPLLIGPFSNAKDPRLKENDGGEMTVVTQALATIRDITNSAIILEHHPPYDRQGGRGSSALRNVLDAEIYLEGQGSKEDYLRPGGLVRAIWTKPDRDGVCPKPIMLERQDNGLLLPTDRKLEHTDRSQKKRDRIGAVREILRDRGSIGAQGMIEALRDHEIIASIRTVQRDLEKLQDAKEVIATGHGPDTEYQLCVATSPTERGVS
jgi:AAA domain-containing protein